MADKFKTVKLYIQQSTEIKEYDCYFNENITIIKRNNYVWILPPFPLREAYDDGEKITAINSREKQQCELRDFFFDKRLVCIKNATLDFDKTKSTIEIQYQQPQEDSNGQTDEVINPDLELKDERKITITQSTTLTELANALPELPENIKQAMKNADNKIKFETEEDTECWNCCSFDLTKLKFWENKEK